MDEARLQAAYQKARNDLLAQRVDAGHWVGELSTSALSTATAVSALTLVDIHRQYVGHASSLSHGGTSALPQLDAGETDTPAPGPHHPPSAAGAHRTYIDRGIEWLARHQNRDGGWGDTDRSHSNIATSMLAVAAFHVAGQAERYKELLDRAGQYIQSQGEIDGLRRRYGKDKTFAVPILTNCALAGLVDWREVAPLPFELACFPQSFYRFLQLPVVSYAIPALVAIGQARYFHRPPRNPLAWAARRAAIDRSLQVLERMQPASGGYLEAAPLTSFVVMSLAATGRGRHPVAQSGVRFLLQSVRDDGSWPIDTNLATWNTTLALNALEAAGEDISQFDCLDWLLDCQHRRPHPFTGAAPGGWAWTDLSGGVPDADDTPGALLALAGWAKAAGCRESDRERIEQAADAGVGWLLDLQNRDGGWPTFCRGWGRLPFDRSGDDLTAHALRALVAWRGKVSRASGRRIATAIGRGFEYLRRHQHADGSWVPLWFGNQDHSREENPVYGTSKVMLAYRDTEQRSDPAFQRGVKFLLARQNADGGWGGSSEPDRPAETMASSGGPMSGQNELLGDDIGAKVPLSGAGFGSSVEETALAVEALLPAAAQADVARGITQGLHWLVSAVESDRHKNPSPIGFYFAKLWYHEKLYPLTFTVSALGQAARQLHTSPDAHRTSHLSNASLS